MRKRVITVIFLGALMLAGGDAWALGVKVKRGGRGRKAQNSSNKDRGADKEREESELHRLHVNQMPAIVKILPADVKFTDNAMAQLGLNKEQAVEIDALKERIHRESMLLQQAQDIARKAFVEAKEGNCLQSAHVLLSAMQSCKRFAANARLKGGLAGILSPKQWSMLFPPE